MCEAKPTEMNNLEKCLTKKVHETRFEFGLSPLHSYIRFFEYFLHVSYRLELKSWRISTAEGKEAMGLTLQGQGYMVDASKVPSQALSVFSE